MTKRSADFDFNKGKKYKTSNADDLWGEDFDPDEVDEAIKASQVGISHMENESILPSYSTFKQNNQPTTSTQFSNTQMIIGKSKGENIGGNLNTLTRQEIENQLKILMKEMEIKNGEVSILRNQIKQIQMSHETANTKIHSEWIDKIGSTQKELLAAKSTLEFKELEIANLKMQLLNIPKMSGIHLSQSKIIGNENLMFKKQASNVNLTEHNIKDNKLKNLHFQDAFNINFSLNIPICIFEKAMEESNLIQKSKSNQISCNAVPILQNKFLENSMKKAIQLRPIYTLVDNKVLAMDYVNSEIESLINCTQEQINSTEMNVNITKIVHLSYELLFNLLEVLKGIEAKLTVEDIRDMDKLHFEIDSKNILEESLFSGKRWHNQECGIEARRSVAVLSQITVYSDYLLKFLLQDLPLLSSNTTCLFVKQLKSGKQLTESNTNFKYLHTLLEVIKAIRLTNRGHYFPGLLSATINLLSNINENAALLSQEIIHLKSNFLKEIIFCRPHIVVIKHLIHLMKIMCKEIIFVNSLCKEVSEKSFKFDDGVLFFNDDTCVIQVLYALLKSATGNFTKLLDESFALDILEFCLNITKSNGKWIRFQQKNQCNCVYKICELSVGAAYNVTRSLAKLKSMDTLSKRQIKIIYCSIKILAMLRARIDFLMIYAIDIHSRFQYIVNVFNRIKDQIKLGDSINSDLLYISTFLVDKPAVADSDNNDLNRSWNTILSE